MKHSFASMPGPLRYSRASGSVVLRCVSFERFWPLKSTGALRPPPSRRAVRQASFGLKLFIDAHASISVPSTEKCSLDSSRFTPRLGQNRAQEPGRDLAIQQPVAVLRKGRVVPHRIIDAEPDKPSEQQIELQPLHQLALRANRIERLQQHRPQQHLGRDRRPAQPGIERRKIARQRFQSRIRQRPDRAQRMIRPDPLLKIDIRKQRARALVRSPHLSPRPEPPSSESSCNAEATDFSTAC